MPAITRAAVVTMPDRFDDQINDFWNEIVSNGDANAGSLDARLAGAIEQVHTLSQSPISDSARERIRRKVLDQSVSTEGATLVNLNVAALPLANPNGKAPVRTAPRRIAPARRPLTRMHWAMLAAAALILFGAVGGFFASGGSLNNLFGGDAGNEPNPIPAATVESGWPQFRGGPARTGYSSDPGPGANLDLRWSFAADDVLGNLVTDAGSVYVYGRQGNLYALDAVTGAERWALDLSTAEYSDENRWPAPAVADGVVYVGTFDGNVLAIDASDGSVIWQRAPSAQPIVSNPLYLDGQLYQVTPEGTIVRLDAATGETVWTWTGDTELSNWSSAAGDGLLFMADVGGDLVAIETATGTTKWIADLNDARRGPAYADGVVYTGGDSRRYYALDATDGSVIWELEPAEGEQALNLVVTPDAVIVSYMNGPMEALDRATGSVLWSVEGPASSLSPHASALAVYCVSADLTALVAYDLQTGAELGRIDADGLGSVAAISGDTIVFGTFDAGGAVRAIGPNDGEPVSVTAGPATAIPAVTEIAQADPTVAPPSTSFDGSQVELVWQSTGDASVPLQYPGGLSIGPDGMLYVADQGLGPIQSFTSDGAFLESWGEQGSGPGQFQAPTSIVFDNDGNRYVADLGNSRIQKFAPDGTFLLEWGSQGDANGQFSEPNIVAIDPESGRIYVTEFLNNRVQVFDLDGNFIDKWGSRGNGNGQFVNPAGIAVNAEGLVFVGDTNNGSGGRVQIFDAFGTWQGSLPDTFTEVWGLAFDAAGNLYVSDYWNNRIQVYDPNLVLIGTIEDVEGAGPLEHPIGLAFDADGFLYVSDYDNQRILKLQLPSLE
jgi:outer membrane protein assembly factor BamB